ncbi:UDP-4-amino-4,6-dideoxy-N-acetyl-beta-L-altrosamine transaminase [Janibacter sp. Soil728]|uniref:DegT/DnrJ/EryC1/StrS family aminotransferase n=1 Tax=Janibacter sp. Soil728 TaxID=1736393 RepID=UPI0006F65F36|nr:DegT/DnrJ/EryC1/StrS family aminotransferase [Janibacter sp. Soil728]KRE35499.1 UDP-4-amino-4,6-dideoxy-N-acetyl-beta-L-altrosamine transaminase [Janibacter sp. Soil728]
MPADLPFLPFARPDITEAEVDAASDAIRSGWLTTGPNAAAFESEFAEFVGGDITAVAVNSATAGLHLALEALGVGPGDEVLVPTWTFTATAEVVRYLGADPVMVDVDPGTLNVDLDVAGAAITDRTRAIMPVHFAGLPVAQQPLRSLADRHGLTVVEDAAHAIPARVGSAHVGAGHNEAAVFSFYATKTVTTGEGGMVTVTDTALADRIRTMRLHGISRDVFDRYQSTTPAWHYEVVAPGFKYNLPDPAAAMGRVQLGRAAAMGARRAAIAATYTEAFADLPLVLPAEASAGMEHAWHLYVIRLGDDAPVDRDSFVQAMAERGIGTSVHFIPLHLHPYWRDRYALSPEDFPAATAAYARVVSLPIFSSMTDGDVERVVTAVREIVW